MKKAAHSIFLLFVISYLLFVAPQAFAQAKTTNYPAPNTNPDVPNNLHNWTQNVMIEVMLSLTCQLVGIDPTQPNGQCLGVDPTTGKIGFLPAGNLEKGEIGGAIGGMNDMIAMLYNPPIHTGDYFQNLAQNFGVVKATHAQTGTGFDGLKPLLNLWSAFRNIVYLLFVVVFVVIGLAIMLRIKIDPRTVMTIQNQIPKIIIGILLVTFSFAIAGFLVDIMWVMIYLLFGLISGISPEIAKSVAELNPAALQGKSPLGAAIGFGQLTSMVHDVAAGSTEIIQNLLGIQPTFNNVFAGIFAGDFSLAKLAELASDPGGAILRMFNNDTNSSLGKALPLVPSFGPNATAPNYIINLLSGVGSFFVFLKSMSWDFPSVSASFLGIGGGVDLGFLGNIPHSVLFASAIYGLLEGFFRFALPYLIVYIVIFIALLFALFRLWFTLIIAYVQILLAVVLAPFWIIGGIVPGSPISFSGWLRDISANLLAFPVTIAMFLLGKVFVDAFKTTTNPFVPPLIGDLGNPSVFSSLIGIGIILMTPNVVNMLKTALKAPKLDTGGVGRAIGVGAGAPMGIFRTGGNIGSTLFGLSNIPGVNRIPFLGKIKGGVHAPRGNAGDA